MNGGSDLTTSPEDCPTPAYHETHYYCPGCTWVAEDAPRADNAEQRLHNVKQANEGLKELLGSAREELARVEQALTRHGDDRSGSPFRETLLSVRRTLERTRTTSIVPLYQTEGES